MENGLLIGIDGGGTHSTAAAAYPDGRIAAVAHGGGLNFHNIGVEPVRNRLQRMVADLCKRSGEEAECVCVGMSALDGPANPETLKRFTEGAFRPGQLDLQSDAYIALMGFTLGAPGVIVICGTGSMLLMVDGEGRQHAGGGWGYLLGDAGSGYTLAREGLLAVIEQEEGLAPATPLTEDALCFFDAGTPRGLIDRVYAPDCTPDRLAGFARCVLTRAGEGDPAARGLLEKNMRRLAEQAARMIAQAPEAHRVGLYGGVFAHSPLAREMFSDALCARSASARIGFPDYPPELGALIHLFRKRGSLTPQILNRMKTSYGECAK